MSAFDEPLKMREAVSVEDFKQRDKLIRRLRKIRADAVLDKNTWEHWNRTHPNEKPIGTELEEAMIDFCDGKIPYSRVLEIHRAASTPKEEEAQ